MTEQKPNLLLSLVNVEAVFDRVIRVLKGISLVVPEAGVVTILGANGAGKTTTLKTISGWIRLENGELEKGKVFFASERIDQLDPEDIALRGLALIPEGRRIFPDLTVRENLILGAYSRRDKAQVRQDLEKVTSYFPILGSRQKQLAGLLSGGEQQMLAVGRGLMSRPKILCLDEPVLGLSPRVTGQIYSILEEINREEKVALLIVEQNASLALDFAHYGYVMENGKIVLEGPSYKLQENMDIKEFYLGLTAKAKRKSYAEIKHYKRRKRWLD